MLALGCLPLVASFSGCLNPRPDDYPSGSSGDSDSSNDTPVVVERETCEDNPLLAECAPPAPATPGNGDGDGYEADNGSPGTGSNPNENLGGGSEADAGAPPDGGLE